MGLLWMVRPLGLPGCEHLGLMGFTGLLDRSFLGGCVCVCVSELPQIRPQKLGFENRRAWIGQEVSYQTQSCHWNEK